MVLRILTHARTLANIFALTRTVQGLSRRGCSPSEVGGCLREERGFRHSFTLYSRFWGERSRDLKRGERRGRPESEDHQIKCQEVWPTSLIFGNTVLPRLATPNPSCPSWTFSLPFPEIRRQRSSIEQSTINSRKVQRPVQEAICHLFTL